MLNTVAFDACAQRSSQQSAPSDEPKEIQYSNAKIELNGEDAGKTNDLGMLIKRLEEILKLREEQRVTKYGTDEIEKTIHIQANRSLKIGEVIKVIEAVKYTGADLQLPIKIKPKDKDYFPSKLTLYVSIGERELSEDGNLILDGINVSPFPPPSGRTLASITVRNDGEYTIGEKRIEKAALESEIRNLIKGRQESERIVFIKSSPGNDYGSVEDISYVAFKAGAKLIYLDVPAINEKVDWQAVQWEEEGITFTLPSDWRKDGPRSQAQGTSTKSYLGAYGPLGGSLQDMNIYITTLEKDFPVPKESLLAADYPDESRRSTYEDLRYLELGGVKGIYSETKLGDEKLLVYWFTYRHYKGKAQNIGIALEAPRRYKDMLTKALNSFKLAHD